jgi:hypothetical protein
VATEASAARHAAGAPLARETRSLAQPGGDRLDRPGTGTHPAPEAVREFRQVRADRAVLRVVADLDVGSPPSAGRTFRIISRGTSGLAGTRVPSNSVPRTSTMSPAVLLSPSFLTTSRKDREVAASLYNDTPHSGKPVKLVPVTPYATSVDLNHHCGQASWLPLATDDGQARPYGSNMDCLRWSTTLSPASTVSSF